MEEASEAASPGFRPGLRPLTRSVGVSLTSSRGGNHAQSRFDETAFVTGSPCTQRPRGCFLPLTPSQSSDCTGLHSRPGRSPAHHLQPAAPVVSLLELPRN